MKDADEPTAPTEAGLNEKTDDDIEVWVVDEDEQMEPIPAESATDDMVSRDLEAMRAALDEAKGQWMRTLADFDNFRKRAERERAEHRRYSVLELVRELVGVADNLARALAADGDVEDLKRGVEMILRHLLDLLRREGLREVAAVGEPFDPTVHEAVSRHEGPAVAQPTVTKELQRGYLLHDRLVRPAMVEVAMPASAPAGATGEVAADEGAADEAGPEEGGGA
jgi:molecular chaperone GrpE